MWYCKDCDKNLRERKGRHIKTARHIENAGGNPYENGKLYKIVNLDDESKVYVGSTYMSLKERYRHHKKDKRRYDRGELSYTTSYSILDNSRIELLENHPCKNKRELKKREQYYIDNIKCINKNRAYGSVVKNTRPYKLQTEDKSIYRKEIHNCECGLTYGYTDKNRHKKSKRHIKRMLEINN